ncbi:MAG: hypothetical protein IPM24_11550 [Bryobacterales bacterium]|nr:hypothetical protein [Bryobacterales bacterium]
MSRLWLLVLCLTACGRYAEFQLPEPHGEPTKSFRWEAVPPPVLLRGAPGEWDHADVLNPAIVRHGGRYLCLYSGFDGATWHTGLAESPDGLVWEKQGRVLSPDASTWEGAYIAANGAAVARGETIFYWYHAGPRDRPAIGLATSPDGRTWRREPAPVLEPGPRGSWDERGVADPFVVEADGWFHLYYLGQDRARRQRLGVARSRDGVRWHKHRGNPLLELGESGAADENGLGEPAVWRSHGAWWMLYTARAFDERRRLVLARSADGIAWKKMPVTIAGGEDWNRAVVCDAEIALEDGHVRVWFGGGDRPSPDENLSGQIGAGRLVPEP